MKMIPLNIAVLGTFVRPVTEQVFDVNIAYGIARRRLRQEVKSQLTGILSGIVPSGKTRPTSWKFSFKDEQVVGTGDGMRVVLVHKKCSSESKEALDDFKDSASKLMPSGSYRITGIPPLPTSRPIEAPYQLELVGNITNKPNWVIHLVKIDPTR